MCGATGLWSLGICGIVIELIEEAEGMMDARCN